jgi:hypothetical protein
MVVSPLLRISRDPSKRRGSPPTNRDRRAEVFPGGDLASRARAGAATRPAAGVRAGRKIKPPRTCGAVGAPSAGELLPHVQRAARGWA